MAIFCKVISYIIYINKILCLFPKEVPSVVALLPQGVSNVVVALSKEVSSAARGHGPTNCPVPGG